MIVANNVTVAGAGFGTDTNIVTIYDKDGSATELPKMSKADIAKASWQKYLASKRNDVLWI